MAQVGSLGEIIFTVSEREIKTIRDYSRKTASRLTTHDIIGQKPITEFLGPGIESVSFTIKLSAFAGINPKQEAEKLRQMTQEGEVVNFILGGYPVGENKWIIESVEETANYFDGHGNIVSSDVNLTLHEYVEIESEGDENAGF